MEESWKMNGNKMKKDNFYHNFIIIYANVTRIYKLSPIIHA